MISFFPEVYPDELAYSWFARYGVRSGYTHYRAIADDLFTSHTAKPNLEFIIELSQDAYRAITSIMPFERFILNHTMFPYYARFLPVERRQKAFEHLLNMDKRFNDMFLRLVKEYADRQDVTEQLKKDNPYEWIGRMNNIQACVREVVGTELICT